MEPSYIIEQYERNSAFYANGGGLTVTGGEPLMQIDFLIDLFTLAKERNIHTCIDSSGIAFNPDSETQRVKLERLMALTDLVMLDIKHIDPGITDDDKYLFDLGYFIGAFSNLKALDVLPYHTMGEKKYESLGMDYKLKGVPPMDKGKLLDKKKVILEGIKKRRAEMEK